MSLAEFDVTGHKVLIVGAGRGIGKGIALAFAEAGADVAIASLTEATVGKVAEEIRAMGRTALPVTGDATKTEDMDRIASQVLAEFGHIDTLVTCVGDSIRKPVVKLPGTSEEGMTEDDWNNVVNINLPEAFQGCRALGPHRLERGQGSVINISGWASFRGRPGYSAYDAAKARNEEGFSEDVATRLIAGENPIKVFREYRGWTQKELSETAGTTAPYLSQIETGRRTGSVKLLHRLAGALRVELDDLV